MTSEIDALVHSEALKTGFTGVLIESLKDGRVLYEHESTRVYMPASVLKLVTSAAALDAFGPDYRFRTELLADGAPDGDGALGCDLILKGYGDSSMETEGLSETALALKGLGIRKVNGNLVADDSYFDDTRMGWGWSWDYQSDYYAAQISALVLNRNTITVTACPAKTLWEQPGVSAEPAGGYVTIVNNAKTAAAGNESSLNIYRRRAKNEIVVSGNIPLDADPIHVRVTVEEPALYVGEALREAMGKQGIELTGRVLRGTAPEQAKVICTHYSEPLSHILALLNKPSDNLIAECLLKELGAKLKEKGSASGGIAAVSDFLKKIGGDTGQANLADGSGLSRLNMISPANIVAVLRYMHSSPHARVYIESLPIAGVDGSLAGRLKETPCEKNVTAKPGYLGWATTLAGYVRTRSGESLAFAFLMNNFLCQPEEVRKIQDRILLLLADLP